MKLEIEDVLSGLECSGRSCSKAFVCLQNKACSLFSACVSGLFCFCRNNFFVTAVFGIFTPLVFIWGCV